MKAWWRNSNHARPDSQRPRRAHPEESPHSDLMPGREAAPIVLSLTGSRLQRVVQFCWSLPALTVFVAFAFAAFGAGYAAHSLTLETSKFHLLPLHQRYATLYKDYAEDFGQLEDIVVVVQSADVETSTAYAAHLAGALRDGP